MVNSIFGITNLNLKKLSTYKEIIPVNNKLIYLQENDKEYIFINDNITLEFDIYKKYGYILPLINNIFQSPSQKIEIIFNINYKWKNAIYPPRFTFNVYKNDIMYYSTYRGIEDNITHNLLYLNIIIDIQKGDKINFILIKDIENDINEIIILDNSNYYYNSL